MRKTRISGKWRIALLVSLLFLAGFFIFSEKDASEERSAVRPVSHDASPKVKQEVYSFRVQGFDENRNVQWGLEGESADVLRDEINITNLRAVYYGEDVTLTIIADSAVYNKKTQDIELIDNIVGRTSDGGEFITDRARWNAKTEEITTDSYVIVTRENMECRGRGLVTKPRLKWVTFYEEVEVDFGPDKKITCTGPFEMDHKNSIAIFNDNVKITDKKSDTFTDKLTVYLDPDTNEVRQVVTEGNVKVVHRGDIRDIGKVEF